MPVIKRKILCLALAASLFAQIPFAGAHAAEPSAESAIVYEPVTGAVLYEKNADERRLIASITKIMTALVVLENCSLDEEVEVTWAHANTEGSSMYLDPDKTYTVRDLLYGLLLASGNDAAAALAEHTAGGDAAFAELMNAKCAQLGLKNTHFENPHGLDGEEHYSTARDMAVITAAAMQNPEFCRIFSCRSYSLYGQVYYNHNRLLGSCEGCLGGKTGYTNAAGRTLVSCVRRDGMTLICVTLSDPDDWRDHEALYSEAFDSYEFLPALPEENRKLSIISGLEPSVSLYCDVEGVVVPKDADVRREIRLPSFAFAPVTEDEPAGEAAIYVGGKELLRTAIRYSATVPLDKSCALSPWERVKRAWYLANKYSVLYPAF